MTTNQDIVSFKSDAWKGTDMVFNYARNMHANRGTNRLKNEIEVGLCAEHAIGDRIVDVGVGTGRASLALARAGKHVTGVDISQEMLDQCRREGGDTPIELVVGDLARLPLADAAFDTLISLNVAVHFPNWREALEDWARVVRPGGRLVFDVHSSDHLDAVGGHYGIAGGELLPAEERDVPERFMLRVGAREIAAAATRCGLSVRALIPYAAVLGGGNVNYWLRDSRLWGYLGDRALSWMAVDPEVFAFGLFLERDVVAALSTSATGRYMVVLEKREDPRATQAELDRHAGIDRAFASLDPTQIRAAVGARADGWAAKLVDLLKHAPNRALLSMALCAPAATALRPLFEDLLGPPGARVAFEGNARARVDDATREVIASWRGDPLVAERLRYAGIDLGATLEYDLFHDVLAAHFFDANGGPA